MTPWKPALAAALLTAALPLVASTATAQNLPPTYGAFTLSTTETDNVSVALQAGGPLAADQILGPPCVGMVANAPDVTIVLEGSGTAALSVAVSSEADTTLVLGLPNGDWLCNDDAVGLNPALSLTAAAPGAYNIWVGTYDTSGFPVAELVVGTVAGSAAPADPPPPTAADGGEYWYDRDGSAVGPVSLAEIQADIDAGTLTRDTLVWQEGMADWVAAAEVAAIEALFPVEPPALPEAPAGPPPLPSAEEVEEVAPPPLPGGEAPADQESSLGDRVLQSCLGVEAVDPELLDDPETECRCIVDGLMAGGLDEALLERFAADFFGGAEELQTVNNALYEQIDDQCF